MSSVALLTARAAAQVGGHPHVAPLVPGFSLVGPPSKVSPLMNEADGVWNLGESTEGVDRGGALGPDSTFNPNTSNPSFVPLLSTPWKDHPRNAGMEHYIGSFRRPVGSHPADETRASFEVVSPKTLASGQKVVLVIFTQPTFGPPAQFDKFAPHDYPGNPDYYDLLGNENATHVDLVERSLQYPPGAYHIASARYTPRTSNRPMVFTLQRLRQVRRAAIILLGQRYGIAPSDVAVLVTGASFGGFTSALAPLFYPQEFHAAQSGAFSAAVRAMPSDFDSQLMFASMLGLAARVGYTMRDTLELPMWCRQEDTDFTSLSVTNRLKVGHMQRPIHFYIGDEDTVTHGTDWVQVLDGSSSPDHSVKEFGYHQFTNTFGNPVHVYWSVVPKHCHGGDRQNVFTIQVENQPPEQTIDGLRPIEVMAQKAYEQLNVPAVPITDPLLGRKIAASAIPTLPSLSPSRPALAHSGYRGTAVTYSRGNTPDLLAEHVGFKRYGQGTWLGADDSLKVASIGEDRDSIFVGSADGYVTRLKMENRGTNPVIQPLVEKARSNIGFLPYALGYATLGLDVGEVDPAVPGLEVAVASYNKIALLRASTLELIRERAFDDIVGPITGWEYDQPRKVQIADVLGDGACEIVFRTYHGHLVVMDKDLVIRYEHGEGGILDLALGPQPTGQPGWLKRPIYLLSARGHVVRLELDQARPFPAYTDAGILAGASTLQYGGLRDLDIVTYQGQPCLAVLCMPQLGQTDAVRFFSVDGCNQIGEFGQLDQPPPPLEDGSEPITISQTIGGDPTFCYVAGHGGDRYAIWSGGQISVWDGSLPLGHKDLGAFPPASGDAAMAAGDIDPASPGQELVVATTAGKVVWLKLSDLAGVSSPPQPLPLVRTFVTDGGEVFEDRCNTSLAATWAMAAEPAVGSTPGKLCVIDPDKTWFDVDPATGNPTWVAQQLFNTWGLVPGMAPNGLTLGSGASGEDEWQTTPLGGETLLFTNPYVPNFFNGTPPWYRPPSGLRPWVHHRDGHWLFPGGGAVYLDTTPNPDRVWCAWWSGYVAFNDLIQSATYELPLPTQPATISGVRGSTQDVYQGGQPPPRWPMGSTGFKPLRTEIGSVAPMNMQGLKLGKVVSASGDPQIVAAAMGCKGRESSHGARIRSATSFRMDVAVAMTERPWKPPATKRAGPLSGRREAPTATKPLVAAPAAMGGRVLVLNASDCKLIGESKDFGLGGMALAVGNLDADPEDEIVFAPLYSPMPDTGQKVRSHLHVLEWSGTGLVEVGSTIPVGDLGSDDFLGYGACGIAIADVPTHGKLVFVATVNGEFVVFRPLATGGLDPTPVFRTVVEGSIGAFGSIVVANLVPDPNDMPEVYLAGSSGIRRFDFQ